jgi:hypothetical protein
MFFLCEADNFSRDRTALLLAKYIRDVRKNWIFRLDILLRKKI